jgi:transposase
MAMAYKEFSRVEIKEIIRIWQTGSGIRPLSRLSGLSRNTIKKYLNAAADCGLMRTGPPPTEEQLMSLVRLNTAGRTQNNIPTTGILEPLADVIRGWITEDRLQLTRIQELLKQRGCDVVYSSLYRFVTRNGWRRSSRATVRMEDTEPGQVAEMDFGRLGLMWDNASGRKRLVQGMVVTLAYSRQPFLWPLFGQTLVEIIEGLEACWAFLGGVPQYLVIDNFTTAVAGADPLNPRLTRGFLEYAQHRGFIVDPTRVKRPQDKPKVESGIRYARERFFKGGSFHDLPDLRFQARQWCLGTAGQRVHGTTYKLPLVVFLEEEQAKLLPWDGEPYDVPDWRTVTVHPDHHVSYKYALYSAPCTTCPPGTKLEVRGDSRIVKFFHRGLLIKTHPRQCRGGRSTDQADYPAGLTAYTMRSPDYLRRKCAELGESVGVFADQLLDGPLPWAKLRQAQKLLRLGERYTASRLDAACHRALTVDLIDVRRLEHMLIEALEEEAVTLPAMAVASPPGRFARHGSVFAMAPDMFSEVHV